MRLNKSQKDAFVRAVMHDVPSVDYDEKAKEVVIASLNKIIPKEVFEFYKKFPDWQYVYYYLTPSHLSNVVYMFPHGLRIADYGGSVVRDEDPEAWAMLVEFSEAAQKQSAERSNMEDQLRGIINSCSTLASAKKRLPEFEKYLPQEASVASNLPVANLVSDLNKMGWPKSKSKGGE